MTIAMFLICYIAAIVLGGIITKQWVIQIGAESMETSYASEYTERMMNLGKESFLSDLCAMFNPKPYKAYFANLWKLDKMAYVVVLVYNALALPVTIPLILVGIILTRTFARKFA